MSTLTTVNIYVLCLALSAMLAIVFVWERQRRKKTLPVWLAASLLGVFLGSAATFATINLLGYEIRKSPAPLPEIGPPLTAPEFGDDSPKDAAEPTGDVSDDDQSAP